MIPTSLSSLNFGTWAGITAGFAVLAGCWRYVVMAFKWVCDLFICRVVVKDEAAKAVMSHVWKHGRKSPFGLRIFGGIQSFVSPKKRVEIVGYEDITSEPILFWFGRVPVIVGQGMNQDSRGSNTQIGMTSGSSIPLTIRFLRGTLDINALLEQGITEYNALRQSRKDSTTVKISRFNVFRMLGDNGVVQEGKPAGKDEGAGRYGTNSPSQIVEQIQHGEVKLVTWRPDELIERGSDAKPFVNHPVDPLIMKEFDEIDIWLKQETWFRSKGIPWYRGYLLFGAPGSGKDTIIRNLAIQHDLPVYAFDLSTYDNRSFQGDFKNAQQNAPAIVLLSDIDSVFVGRENVAVKDKNRTGLTFDCLLNTLSGIGSSDGVLLFITTNRLETLDPAIGIPVTSQGQSSESTRPGRVNKAIHVGPMKEPERRKLANVILGDWPHLIDGVVAASNGKTAAQVQERCVQLATEEFWKSPFATGEKVDHNSVDWIEYEKQRKMKQREEEVAQKEAYLARERSGLIA